MRTCRDCGKQFSGKIYPNGLCQSCYNYIRHGGQQYALPPLGVIAKDYRGYVICHICGKAYKRLGSHARESHDMTICEYKAKFELCNSSRTTETSYSKTMHDNAIKYDMPARLIVSGKATRIQSGDTHMRKGKQVRLQEILNKQERNKK